MPRIRSLKPEIHSHRKTGALSDRDFRVFVGCITQADDEGRLVADAVQLRAVLFAYHPRVLAAHVTAALERLDALGLIQLYQASGTQYAWLPSWADHQRIHKNHWTASRLPMPPALRTGPGSVHEQSRTSPVGSEGKGKDQGRDRRGEEFEGRDTGDASPAPPLAAVAEKGQANGHNQRRRPAPGDYQETVERIRRQHPELAEAEVEEQALHALVT